jgi:hypothetical protein
MDIVESHKQVVNTKMENMDDISLVEYRTSAKRQDMFIKKANHILLGKACRRKIKSMFFYIR